MQTKLSLLFSEFGEEAVQVQRRAFLELHSYCRKKFGLDFHAVDVQRMTSSDADVTHRRTNMLVDLIARTQAVSAGPNFVVRFEFEVIKISKKYVPTVYMYMYEHSV